MLTDPQRFQRLVVYAYPLTGLLDVENQVGWDLIPGARGCTPESCAFRDHAAELVAAGAAVVGVSTQSAAYRHEAAERPCLPFPLLSDARLELARAMRLLTFEAELRPAHDGGGRRNLLRRLTFVVKDGLVEKVFYPVFPPDRHPEEVLLWLRATG